MDNFLLVLHSWLRWVVLLAGLFAIIKSYAAWKNKSPYTGSDKTRGAIFIGSLHLQLVVGLLLYSSFMRSIMIPFAEVMKEKELRYFAVEHSLVMVIAIAIAQIGSIVSKKAATDELKHKKAFIYFLVAMILILMMIPMGMMGVSRPWFRM